MCGEKEQHKTRTDVSSVNAYPSTLNYYYRLPFLTWSRHHFMPMKTLLEKKWNFECKERSQVALKSQSSSLRQS